ncbi:NtaA/DmoA family FMN-dependent monooxygenase [Bartonella sp. HY329]|uniref:NtaA/DmoA family FMN-dependent monooxygenase n=1 Tax=unclassified Bartonella TaxID=2645622 RepID=UPI0021C7B6BE|nr:MULTISPECIES: NtaA/DmoA family FMN-dependent monooxygenase [unclassified Bartonella]UXM96282.1 NtaA/DmoA family FMN-dependent monooxygenase [Bartonella sp. HY329]UXN10606.1 NtaA/DmoA family FMN-dependent monooxygenase [Bartonella sp. HY328]
MRRMHINTMIYGLGSHISAWRLPEIDPLAVTKLGYWQNLAQSAEKFRFDAIFLGEILALHHESPAEIIGSLDPILVLSAIASVTQSIGLIGTSSTTYDHPFHIARRFASLDHISNGRAGWNIVTSSTLPEAKNFGRDVLAPHEERYARAKDVVEAASYLWSSWKPNARLADKESGVYFQAEAVEKANYRGHYIRSSGPLTVPPSPQGHPILTQGGISNYGRDFASRYADISFTVQCHLDDAQDFYKDIKQRAVQSGRGQGKILVFPGLVPVIADTYSAAEQKIARLNDLAPANFAWNELFKILGFDLSQYNLSDPLPTCVLDKAEDPQTPGRAKLLLNAAKRNNYSLQEFKARFLCSRGHLLLMGPPNKIADDMQKWFDEEAADGFNVIFPILPNELDLFGKTVIPILEERKLRTPPIAGETLRQRYNLPDYELLKAASSVILI